MSTTDPTTPAAEAEDPQYQLLLRSRVHFAKVPFVALCGSDMPNQQTTTTRGNVTCGDCAVLMFAEYEFANDAALKKELNRG